MTLPNTMQALVLKHSGYSNTAEGPSISSIDPYLDFKEVEVPTPADGEVLIKVIRANINPSDLHFIKGEYGLPRREGVPAGFEAVGEVVASGSGGEKLVGKRVAFLGTTSGAWADYAISNANMCVPVRDDMRDEDAATLFVNPLTAVAMFDIVKKSGSKSFIMTAAASQLCKLIAGLAKETEIAAISLVRRDEHVASLPAYGSKHVLNVKSADFMSDLGKIMKEEKPRVMLDAVGDQQVSDIFFAMPSGARWVSYGKLDAQNPALTQMGQFIFMSKQIEGFWLTKWMNEIAPQDLMAAIGDVQQRFVSGSWRTDVAETISLSDARDKLPAAVSKMNTGKVMLVP